MISGIGCICRRWRRFGFDRGFGLNRYVRDEKSLHRTALHGFAGARSSSSRAARFMSLPARARMSVEYRIKLAARRRSSSIFRVVSSMNIDSDRERIETETGTAIA
jgi:hypothetical protein